MADNRQGNIKTNNPSKTLSSYIITGKAGFAKQSDTTVVSVSIIEH